MHEDCSSFTSFSRWLSSDYYNEKKRYNERDTDIECCFMDLKLNPLYTLLPCFFISPLSRWYRSQVLAIKFHLIIVHKMVVYRESYSFEETFMTHKFPKFMTFLCTTQYIYSLWNAYYIPCYGLLSLTLFRWRVLGANCQRK